MTACITGWVRKVVAANTKRPLFVLTYGVENYVEVAVGLEKEFGASLAIVGTQDLAALGRAAAPPSTSITKDV
jgi:hypothetical protein